MITNSILNIGAIGATGATGAMGAVGAGSAVSPLLKGSEQKSQGSVIENNPFRSLLEEAIGNVKEADAGVQLESYKLVTGESDDLHNITIASTQLTLATDLLIQIRNKTMDAYNEIMRMGI